jgi:mannosyltransferase OCH1-like enzyme
MLLVFSNKNDCNMAELIVHQIAPKDPVIWHPFWSKCRDSWKQHHEVMLWNDQEDIDNLIENHYPQYWNLYKAFPFHVMKIDFVRLAMLHRFGGLYADMDVFCYRPIPFVYTDKDFVAIENLTAEYTSARYENSMMAAQKGNPFLLDLMNYVKILFINSRHHFEKPYRRTVKNDNLINNITGSGMLESAMKTFHKTDHFPCALFNNRPAAYDCSFITKHAHSSIWGKEYVNKQDYNELVFMDGIMYQVDTVSDRLKDLIKNESHYITTTYDFDFHFDYTDGMYLKKDTDLTQINKHIQNAMVRFNEYFKAAHS